MSVVKHVGTLYPFNPCPVFEVDISSLAHGATLSQTVMRNAYNKSRVLLDKNVLLRNRGKKTAARENRVRSDTSLQEYSYTNQKRLSSSLSLASRMWSNDRYSRFCVHPLHVPHLGISNILNA